MKALDITKHKTHLTNILIDVFKNSTLSSALGFKGGTAAMLLLAGPLTGLYLLGTFAVSK